MVIRNRALPAPQKTEGLPKTLVQSLVTFRSTAKRDFGLPSLPFTIPREPPRSLSPYQGIRRHGVRHVLIGAHLPFAKLPRKEDIFDPRHVPGMCVSRCVCLWLCFCLRCCRPYVDVVGRNNTALPPGAEGVLNVAVNESHSFSAWKMRNGSWARAAHTHPGQHTHTHTHTQHTLAMSRSC